jgi:hypothetical protein
MLVNPCEDCSHRDVCKHQAEIVKLGDAIFNLVCFSYIDVEATVSCTEFDRR